MADSTDLYNALGIPRGASDADIKKAYRKAALQWHPDKNPENKEQAEVMFKNIAKAYEVLSDAQKRSLYDQGGMDAVDRGGLRNPNFGGEGMDSAFNIFEQFFGGRDPFADFDSMFADMGGGGRPGGFGRRATAPARGDPFGGSPFGGSMFNDDFFQGGFGGGGGGGSSFSTSFSTSTSSRSGGGGMSTSTSSTTRIVNGQRVTVTEKKVRKPDGTVEVTRSESSGDSSSQGQGQRGMMQDDFFGGAFGGGFFGGGGSRSGNHRLGF